ncbi:MAG TPA: methionine adenosyltransferase [Myxococcales bacterium LLY-WYZ-16_1]|nr:methionine adenosyltransferase [Myxococcales bacterium LLY-WYZ-16_1]
MELRIHRSDDPTVDASDVEVVERKGLGHPDTICDALAESISRALSWAYVAVSGSVLHHNVDKVLLRAGASEAWLGGGQVVEPMDIYLAGRATHVAAGRPVPVEDMALEETRRWLAEHLHALEPERHVRVHCGIRSGSRELVELSTRQMAPGKKLANDTSCGVGYAPLSRLEQIVMAVETRLSSLASVDGRKAVGEDVKVMGVRLGEEVELTVACALIGPELPRLEDALALKAELAEVSNEAAKSVADLPVRTQVNTADDPEAPTLYLTVTGTSAECGDDGEAGRGNRANGLITPYRPMTMESVAGKNPSTHVGKIYNVVAERIASSIVSEVQGIDAVECRMVSRIGHPIDEPWLVDVRTQGPASVSDVYDAVRDRVHRGLTRLSQLEIDMVSGRPSLDLSLLGV